MPDYIRLGIFKATELVLAITICVLFTQSWAEPVAADIFVYTGLAAFLWVPIILAIGILIKRPVHMATNIFCCFVQFVLCIIGSALLMNEAKDAENEGQRVIGICGGIFGIITAVILLIEIVTDCIFDFIIAKNRNLSASHWRRRRSSDSSTSI